MFRRWVLIVLGASACGKSSAPSPPPPKQTIAPSSAAASSVAKAKTPVSAICQEARKHRLGPRAACVETPLPDLTTPAGTVTRVLDGADPIHPYVYALTRPAGEIVIGTGSGLSR